MGTLSYEFSVEKDDFERAGEASSKIKKILMQLGMDSSIIRRVAIGAYEAEMNLVIHSLGGSIRIDIDPKTIVITAEDIGPGIEDIELAMKEGYSTATEKIREMGFGAGMGLPNMKKCSDVFEIESEVGKGTKIVMKMFLKDGD